MLKRTFVVAILISAATLGCNRYNRPPLYGPKSCTDEHDANIGLTAYLPPDAKSAVCMPTRAAVYIMFVQQLSFASASESSQSGRSVNPTLSYGGFTIGGAQGATAKPTDSTSKDSKPNKDPNQKKEKKPDGKTDPSKPDTSNTDGSGKSDSGGNDATKSDDNSSLALYQSHVNITSNYVYSDPAREKAMEYCKELAGIAAAQTNAK